MKDIKSIKELIVEFIFIFEQGANLPNSLRGKIPLQHIVWEFIEDCNALLLCLITDKILTKASIQRLVNTFDECIDVVCEYVDKKEQIKLAMYWMSVINYMNKRCLEEEKFESCSNIKKFSDLYFIIAPNSND
jgi:hypothetical protein